MLKKLRAQLYVFTTAICQELGRVRFELFGMGTTDVPAFLKG